MISQKALDLIVDAEGCDLSPAWPGGSSGVTYGFGYDLGYNTREQIQKDWGSYVNGNTLSFMFLCSGRTGLAAKQMINPSTKILRITQSAAEEVFKQKTLPRFKKLALDTYPNLENLPEDTIGAITSLVFNRGTSFGIEGQRSWDSRKEMRELKPLIENGLLQPIADKIREMSRLWEGKGLDGLITRRNNEADLIHA
jgi:GH24 family phage-related lysozyme (muramidase)